MLTRVVLVGRPNVGKSTLFNCLTGRRDALVAAIPGLTRDRRYGRMDVDDRSLLLIDTGGLFGDDDLAPIMRQQASIALEDADYVLFLVDARAGVTAGDQDIADWLRRQSANVQLVINKIDGVDPAVADAEFSIMGFDEPLAVSAAHSRGLAPLRAFLHGVSNAETEVEEGDGIRVAVIGRPNVGKSTLINRLLGEERQVVMDMPGTTRDAIDIPLKFDGDDYVLIDTAGVRRKGKTDGVVEKFSVVKSLEAIERAHVVALVLDASEGLVEQDLHILTYAADAGSGIVILVNKWDGLSADDRDAVRQTLDRRLTFIPWAPVRYISALHGSGVGHVLGEVKTVYEAGLFDVPTSLLTRLLESLVHSHPPPSVKGRHIKLKFASNAGRHPPRISVHGNQTESVPASYKKYLENGFREALNLVGNPVSIVLKSSDNPYAGKRNLLTPRQIRQRERMIKHRR
ncbi:MAG: ribosome biogenesis GTPase Der [Proteobacteria bacterium]|nr:ribosome biogenesis GTPase Der [Pseudomonadota bacterium]